MKMVARPARRVARMSWAPMADFFDWMLKKDNFEELVGP